MKRISIVQKGRRIPVDPAHCLKVSLSFEVDTRSPRMAKAMTAVVELLRVVMTKRELRDLSKKFDAAKKTVASA